jgi:hypothetical protein
MMASVIYSKVLSTMSSVLRSKSKSANVSPNRMGHNDYLLQKCKYSHYQIYRLPDLFVITFETKDQREYA